MNTGLVPRSLAWATDIDVLPVTHAVARRGDYLVVRSPSNPTHYWGNLLLFDAPPVAGDRARWETLFAAEFAGQPGTAHRAFGWDRADDAPGAAEPEFVGHGYRMERTVSLVADAAAIVAHARANREVQVRALRPGDDDEPLWDQVVALQVAARDREHFEESSYRAFARGRLADLRQLFALGRGAWYVALLGDLVVGSLGIVVTDERGRFQMVDTAECHRRQGICSRLVVDAARHAAGEHGARRLVICADPGYHALGIYESLGFRRVEVVTGVLRQPPGDVPSRGGPS